MKKIDRGDATFEVFVSATMTKNSNKLKTKLAKLKQQLKAAKINKKKVRKELYAGNKTLSKKLRKVLNDFKKSDPRLSTLRIREYVGNEGGFNYWWFEESKAARDHIDAEDRLNDIESDINKTENLLKKTETEEVETISKLEKLQCENETMRKLLEKLSKEN